MPKIQSFLNIDFGSLLSAGYSAGFLFGPLLYLYTKSITGQNYSLGKITYLHFLPFLIALVNFVLVNFLSFTIVTILLHVQILTYMALILLILSGYRSKLKNYYSSVEELNLSWLMVVVFAFMTMWLVDLVSFILWNVDPNHSSYNGYLLLISLSINFIFANYIVYKGLTHPDLFIGAEETEKYKTSVLKDDLKQEYLDKLVDFIESEKPYLTPGLTLSDVSAKLEIHPKYLSQVINENLQKNFHDFINYYRIKEAQRQIEESLESKKTILEVLYDCGFNTKSVFNTSFKKIVGLTPTQYKNSIIN
jgi:AraC-like DNA-binding protein